MTNDIVSSAADDENRAVLREMVEQGDDLSIPREMDFSILFPTEGAALEFAIHLLRNDLKVSFSAYEENEELPWEVRVHPFMLPTVENISGFETLLADGAEPLGGSNDGWGCESQG
ncbi:regulator of ribonuclease activity B [Luteibacter rhizovicinus]|uniref:Regulator of ribonuclease activity B n=1 Tax=Luteibacter rhizovicinus TaxID=242606 RepID=A0A4R3YV42_9GAMM|nr:ribonuclease E inhibitor RraB [Luteibacter rhizovicinus]TCV96362.1 regulator of ribonuclease activity B [Luteibacter rhizovicinus]